MLLLSSLVILYKKKNVDVADQEKLTVCIIAIKNISETDVVSELTLNLKNIAAAHCIMTLAITGIIGLQVAHFYLNKRADKAELAEASAAAAAKKSK